MSYFVRLWENKHSLPYILKHARTETGTLREDNTWIPISIPCIIKRLGGKNISCVNLQFMLDIEYLCFARLRDICCSLEYDHDEVRRTYQTHYMTLDEGAAGFQFSPPDEQTQGFWNPSSSTFAGSRNLPASSETSAGPEELEVVNRAFAQHSSNDPSELAMETVICPESHRDCLQTPASSIADMWRNGTDAEGDENSTRRLASPISFVSDDNARLDMLATAAGRKRRLIDNRNNAGKQASKRSSPNREGKRT